jgi:hypothetical protein
MELPDLARRAELVRRYAHLLEHFGAELGDRPMVRQNGDFFPDPFHGDGESLTRLVRRLQSHAGLADVPIEVRLSSVDADDSEGSGGSCGTGSCGSGACAPTKVGSTGAKARLEERPSGWVLNVFDAELHHPVALTCTLARALAHVFLAETQSGAAPVEAPFDLSVDLTAVALGLGTLVLEGSYIYSKSCGGPSVSQLTTLPVGELAVACALFIAVGGHSGRRALTELGTTQRVLLSEANDWAASNPSILRQLVDEPGLLAVRAPELTDTRSWLLRLFDRKPRPPKEPSLERALSGALGDAELLGLARAARDPKASRRSVAARRDPGNGNAASASSARDANRDELRALVDEALRG